MKQRYFIYLSYDGTRYHGWQVQPNAITVQQEIDRCLSTLLRTEVLTTGAGRTDTGVHARLMVAHFDFEGVIDTTQLAYRMNRMLPADISVSRIEPVSSDMHARFSALARTYYYNIHQDKDPFLNRYSTRVSYQLDFRRMNEAASLLIGEHDFAAFCKADTDVKTTICRVSEAQWERLDDAFTRRWRFKITANRFLRNMVRAVVGTLIDVGRGRISIEELKAIMASGNRSNAGESVPAHGLTLVDIKYGPSSSPSPSGRECENECR